MDELKNCPFCGIGFVRTEYTFGVDYVDPEGYFVKEKTDKVSCTCLPLEAIIPIETWNNRPIEDALRAEITKLRAELDKTYKFVEAFGLLTTLSPKMEIDCNNPLSMAQRIERETIAMRAELEQEREKNRWIPVGERLPVPKQKTLIINDGVVQEWVHSKSLETLFLRHVTFWMPLPAPPEVD